jgi:hypothetical protein
MNLEKPKQLIIWDGESTSLLVEQGWSQLISPYSPVEPTYKPLFSNHIIFELTLLHEARMKA